MILLLHGRKLNVAWQLHIVYVLAGMPYSRVPSNNPPSLFSSISYIQFPVTETISPYYSKYHVKYVDYRSFQPVHTVPCQRIMLYPSGVHKWVLPSLTKKKKKRNVVVLGFITFSWRITDLVAFLRMLSVFKSSHVGCIR